MTKHGRIDIGTLYHETSIEAVCVLVSILVALGSLIPISERFTVQLRLILLASLFLFGTM